MMMPNRSNHARPEDGSEATSHMREAMQRSPTTDNVSDGLRFTRLLIDMIINELYSTTVE